MNNVVIKRFFNIFERQISNNLFHFKSDLLKPIFKSKINYRWNSTKNSDKLKVSTASHHEILRTYEERACIENQLEVLRNKIKEKGNHVRQLKISGASSIEIENEVKMLKAHKKELEVVSLEQNKECYLDKARMVKLIKNKFYFEEAFSAYGGVRGQYDYGPTGCQIMENILAEWHKHFIVKDRMMKINCSIITPDKVLRASGHVDRFTDFVIRDKSGVVYRLDHLIKKRIEDLLATQKLTEEERTKMTKDLTLVEGKNLEELNSLIKIYDLKSPETNEDLEDPVEFNLMFPVALGPLGNVKGFLKPEHAQGIFLNFKKLLEMSEGRLPFACAQVGTAFRNELGTKSRILRVREFTLAEIEHFCYPNDKTHAKFKQISSTKVWLWSACNQINGERPTLISIGEALQTCVISNETLGYYLARAHAFFLKIGIHPRKLRFRQHLTNEVAHYAQECWDAECLTSYGWVECMGCADRSAYDLTQHSKATGVNMCVELPLSEPREEEVYDVTIDKKSIKNTFGEEADSVIEGLNEMTLEHIEKMERALKEVGEFTLKELKITREMVPKVEKKLKEVTVERIIPSVIEPSFGIGRIFYTLLEHTFRVRPDKETRSYFAIPPVVAPVKVAILPLFRNEEVNNLVHQLGDSLTDEDLSVWIDESKKSVGRRYVKMDEMSVPFCVTVDQDTLMSNPPTVSLRDRDSMEQLRIQICEVPDVVKKLSRGLLSWREAMQKWPTFTSQESVR